jgi:YidC/Oxa1 family membrane protein insertase
MTDIRRTLLWVVFTFSLFLIWDAWNKHNGQPSMVSVAASPASPEAMAKVAAGAASAATPIAPHVVPSEKVTISTDLIQATLDTKGGELVRVELLQQHEQHQIDAADHAKSLLDRLLVKVGWAAAVPATPELVKKNVVLLDQSKDRYYTAQTGLWPSAAGPGALPEHHTVMRLVSEERVLKEGAPTLVARFESPDVGGVKLVKTYTFTRGDYAIGVKHEVINASGVAVSPRLYLQLVRDGKAIAGGTSLDSTFTGPAVYTEASKFKKIEFKDIDKGQADFDKSADNGWVAMVQHYFTSAWLVGGKQPREFFAGKVPGATDEYAVRMFLPLGEIAAGASKTLDAQLYVGPQEDKRLKGLSDVAEGLDLVRDYGRLTIIAKPLFWLLSQLHTLLGNWGWSIVLLVLLLKIAFYGLTASGYRSMARMKAVNPRIAELNERYKNDPQKKSQEMMRIYKEEKINPIGGCLPILVQMPFFIALYSVLLASVEMRNAPWVGWIIDLSAKDPYFILPLLMTATTLLQTWLNPTPPDPMQAKMMWMMPLVFSVMFFAFPAGLVLYWLTNNILSIAQQYLINKKLGVLGK